MKGGKKYNAMFLALCMIVTAFVAVVSLPVMAHEDPGPGSDDQAGLEARWSDTYMEDDPAVADVDEEIIFNYDGSNMYLLGDDDDDVYITIDNTGVDNLDNVIVTLASGSSTVIIDDGTDSPAGTWFAGTLETFNFLIDIANSGNVETTYPLTLTVDYDIGVNSWQDTFNFDIYVSSRFDNDNGDSQRDTHDDLPNMEDTIGDIEFEYGTDMREGRARLTNYGSDQIWDITGTISSMDSEIVLRNTAASNPGPIGANSWFDLLYRLDVPINNANPTDPGDYGGQMQVVYSRNVAGIDKVITENPRSIELTVDFTPRLTASGTTTIEQGETEATWNVTFQNEGNVDLSDLMISVSPDFNWFDVTMHHYENPDPTYMPEVDIGDLSAGVAGSAVSVKVAANPWLPDGIHRIPFDWNGWYYDDASTGNPTAWIEIGGFMYDDDMNSMTPEVGLLYEDVDESGDWSLGDAVIESVWDGAYTDIEVDDTNGLSFSATLVGSIDASWDVTNRQITVDIYNNELIDYKDLFVELQVGTGTPFFDPADHSATVDRVEMAAFSDDRIDARDWARVYFMVDVNAAWWQQDDPTNIGMHLVPIYVDATNEDTEERIEDTQIDVAMEIRGFGPELFATVVDYGDIEPGKEFTLTVTITNFGDDTARDVNAYLRADFVTGWTIVDQFVTSISSYGGNNWFGGGDVGDASWGWETDWRSYDKFNRSNSVSPGDIGVDNVPQIVELNDWIKRRETPPQGKVLWIHLNRLEAGEEYVFTFEMISDVNMVKGMAYYETLDLYYVDSNGRTYGPPGSGANEIIEGQQVLIRSGKGDKYTGEEEMDWSVVLYAIIFLIIALIVFLIGFALGGKGGRPAETREEPYKPFEEEEYKPPEEEIAPPPPEEKPPV